MKQAARSLSRRKFLVAAGAGTAATAAALVARTSSSGSASEGKADKRATRGYHASEHVHNYYRTTKV